MKKKQLCILAGILILSCVLVAGGYCYFVKYLPEQKSLEFIRQDQTKKGTLGTRISPEIIAVKHIHNGDWPVVQWRLPKMREDYIEDKVKMREYMSEMMMNSNYVIFYPQTYYVKAEKQKIVTKKYELEIYGIQGEIVKRLYTIDMMKTFKQAGIEPNHIEKNNHFFGNGEYVEITNDGKDTMFVELQTGKIYKENEKVLTEDKNQLDIGYIFNQTNFVEKHKDHFFPLNNEFDISVQENSEKTYGLTKEYPEVQKLLEATEGEDTKVTVNYSQNPPTLEELLKLIIPVGEDPLEELKTKDGEAITSYEQLEQLTNEYNEKLKQEKKNEED